MFNRLKQKLGKMIASEHVAKGIFVASILEATIVPIPLEAVLLPVMQARRDKIWMIAFTATLGCLVGAMFAYALGYFLFDLTKEWLVAIIGSQVQLDEVIKQMNEQGFYFLVTIGIVPFPLQVGMVAAGATGFSIGLYILAITISRVIRYYGIALVVYYAGNYAERIIKRHKYTLGSILLLLVLSAWWLSNL